MSTFDPKLFEKALALLKHSYSPYSRFPVSCCIKTANGQYYAGCNVENASYGLALCAEANAIGQMVSHGDKVITEMLVIGKGDALCTPCGACRQRIREFANADTLIHIASPEGYRASFTLGELLPHSFGPENLE